MSDLTRAESVAHGELAPDERLLWAGVPDAGRMALSAAPLTCFAVPWTAFAVFWMVMAGGMSSRAGGGFSLFPLFGLPFVLFGFGMLLAPLWASMKAKNTVYAVTNQRLMIITEGRTRSVQSFGESDIRQIERKERADGSGDLVFARRADFTGSGSYNAGHRNLRAATPIGFFGIPDVRAVERLVRQVAGKG